MSLLAELLSQNLIVRWLTGRRQSFGLAVSMAGVTLGERVILIGCREQGLLPALAAKTGLTGRACAVDPDPQAVARVERSAEKAGVLVEVARADFASLPYDPHAFDVAVVCPGGSLGEGAIEAALSSAHRLLRPGGRCLVYSPEAQAGEGGAAVRRLTTAGYRGAHVLAEREGQVFVEAMKPTDL